MNSNNNNKIPTAGQTPNPNAPKYAQAFVPKIVRCESCGLTIQSATIEIIANPDAMILQAEAAHKKNKPLCLAPALIIVFDSALVSVRLLGIETGAETVDDGRGIFVEDKNPHLN